MNDYSNTGNSGALKNFYAKGPVSQLNNSSPMLAAIRKKRDALKTR